MDLSFVHLISLGTWCDTFLFPLFYMKLGCTIIKTSHRSILQPYIPVFPTEKVVVPMKFASFDKPALVFGVFHGPKENPGSESASIIHMHIFPHQLQNPEIWIVIKRLRNRYWYRIGCSSSSLMAYLFNETYTTVHSLTCFDQHCS